MGGRTLHVRVASNERVPEAEELLKRVLGPDVRNGTEPQLLSALVAE